jgi:hypothetical protein
MITTRFILSFIYFSFLNKLPSIGISFKTGSPDSVWNFLDFINPPIITLSALFNIAVVITSFFEVSKFSLVVDSFASSRTVFICKMILLFEILGFTFSRNPISSLL